MTEEVKSESEKKKEDWMNSKWRPAMGWMYMLTCVTDFVLFPILWSLLQTVMKQPITQWQPLTLQGAGLFHIAMGAVLGIAAMGRTQEKLAGANNGGVQQPTTPSVSASATNFNTGAASPAPSAPGFGSGSTASSGPAASSFGSASATPAFGAVTTSASGKPGPAQPNYPEI